MRLESLRKQVFDEIMETVMDNLKPLQENIASARSSLRPNQPPAFDGSRDQARGFLETCLLYTTLRPGDFPTEATKFGWILTFMTSGRALTWRNSVLLQYGEKGAYPWKEVVEFADEVKREFYLISEDEDALVVLEGLLYFQKQSEVVDTYINRVSGLLKCPEIKDLRTQVVKFQKGLLPSILKALSELRIFLDPLGQGR